MRALLEYSDNILSLSLSLVLNVDVMPIESNAILFNYMYCLNLGKIK